MRRADTRYKGVWSAGYNEALEHASRVLVRFVQHGGLAFDAPDAWERNTLALRLGYDIAVPDRNTVITAMEMLLAREQRP